MSTLKAAYRRAEQAGAFHKSYLSGALDLERLEIRAASFCNLVEAYLRAGDDCVPVGLRDTSESDVVAALQDLRGLIEAARTRRDS